MSSKEKLAKNVMPSAMAALGFFAMRQVLKGGRLRQINESLAYEATHDKLTGLLNRHGLERLLERSQPPLALLYVDSTNQKAVNDKISHKRGDEAIQGTADLLKRCLRPDDYAARIGGDEFIVVLNRESREGELTSTEELLGAVTSRIYDTTQAFLRQDRNQDLVDVGFDIAVGGAVWDSGMTVDHATSLAERAMYDHKAEQHEANGKHR